jgi:DNA-binding NarL/FixJ family response regulator
VKEIKSMYANTPLAVISSMPAGEAEETCIEAGADIYIEKSAAPNEITSAIQGLFAAEPGDDEAATVTGETKLSKRQKQLIVMLDRGLSNRDIAAELDISEHTVKVHLWRLFRRLDVKSRTQTLHFARMNGLL